MIDTILFEYHLYERKWENIYTARHRQNKYDSMLWRPLF